MALGTVGYTEGVGRRIVVDTIAGDDWPVAKVVWDDAGIAKLASVANPLPSDIRDMPAGWRNTDSVAVALMIDALMVPSGVPEAPAPLTRKFAAIDVATTGDNTIVAAVPAKKILVVSYDLVVASDVTLRWKSGAATNKSGPKPFAARGGQVKQFAPLGHVETALGEALVLNLSAAVAVGGELTYVEVP